MTVMSRFGVPLGGGAGRGGMLQPKVKYKFRVRVINFGPIAGGLELTQQVMTASRPTMTSPPVEVQAYASRAYYASKPEWGTISIELRDDVTNAVSKLVGHQVQKQQNHFEQTSPLAGVNYKFNMFMETMDGGNDTVLEQWYLEGCFLTEVNYGGFDYGSSDPMTISLTVRCDMATQSGGLMPLLPQLIPGVLIG
jgi:hypothetical protein